MAVQVVPDLHSWKCPLCGGLKFQSIYHGVRDVLTGKPGHFEIVRCLSCNLHSTAPQLSGPSLAYYYRDTYSGRGQLAAHGWQTGWIGNILTRYRLHKIAKVQPVRSCTNLLDVGCGFGGFMTVAHALTGCRSHVIDSDSGSIAQAKMNAQSDELAPPPLVYQTGELAHVVLPDDAFDVVCFFQSLEHHSDPVQALNHAYRLLNRTFRASGVFFSGVDGFRCWYRNIKFTSLHPP